MEEDTTRGQDAELVGQRLIDEIRELATYKDDCEKPKRRKLPVASDDVRRRREDGDDEMLRRVHG